MILLVKGIVLNVLIPKALSSGDQGPVVQSCVSSTLGLPKIQSKLSHSLSINLEIFLPRTCLDR
jgi:hypothetical protein